MNTEELLQATENLDTDDFADILQQLPKKVLQEVLNSLRQQDRERVEQVLSYPEDTAGGPVNQKCVILVYRSCQEPSLAPVNQKCVI